ncbi:MAG: GGDEF domain-containing protein [Lachnospiraceae bacterium]
MLQLDIRMLLFIILSFCLNVGIFTSVDLLLENRRMKKVMIWGVCIFNTLFFVKIFSIIERKNITEHYILIIICLLIEFIIIYKEPIMRLIFVSLTFTIHMMIIRAVAMGIYSIVLGISLFEVNESVYAIDTLNITIVLLVIVCIVIRGFVPPKTIKIINQHKEQLLFITIWLIFANLYFVFQSIIFSTPDPFRFVKYNIIAVSLTMIFALYTVLVFTMITGRLLEYKKKTNRLTGIMNDEKQYKSSIIEQAILGLEINLTNDEVIFGFGKSYDVKFEEIKCYSEMILATLPTRIHEDDLNDVLEFMSIQNLLEHYYCGDVDLSIEYRSTIGESTDYIWLRVFFTLYKAGTTDSIVAFSYAKNIDSEKRLELEVKERAERDTLTGLYNHGMTKKLVNEFIKSQKKLSYKGALLILDIDNFKQINDNFGHSFGDEVLCSISNKLKSCFRCGSNNEFLRKEDDIIGRTGGDEFMVFVKTPNLEGLPARLQKICELLHVTYTTDSGRDITISTSIGIALITSSSDDFKTLYSKADVALYISKGNGKNCFTYYKGESF